MNKLLILFLTVTLPFLSCGNKQVDTPTNQTHNEVQQTKEDTIVKAPRKSNNYRIVIESTDSVKYHLAKVKSNHEQVEIEKIDDFETAKEMLKGIVFFNEDMELGGAQNVREIHYRNGQLFIAKDYYSFEAYYPTEDILLCEGGHTTDVSFNLKNGKETEDTGNPKYISTSPGKLFRINGHFNGQQCYSYFIQKKIENEFQKIIQLDQEFEKQKKIWLCVVGNTFWQSDTTFYLSESSDYKNGTLNTRYFKIKLIEK